jgi:opacity protein-like surface antigen
VRTIKGARQTSNLIPLLATSFNTRRWSFRPSSRVSSRWIASGDLEVIDRIRLLLVRAKREGGKYVGWSVGGGIDYAFTRNIIGRIEYLYDDFGHKDYTGSDGDPYRVSLTGHTLRGALTWKLDGFGKGPTRY